MQITNMFTVRYLSYTNFNVLLFIIIFYTFMLNKLSFLYYNKTRVCRLKKKCIHDISHSLNRQILLLLLNIINNKKIHTTRFCGLDK
jgi:hypothetical protein